MISLSGINKSFGAVQVLHHTELHVAAGETVGISGPSGCGKTTLLRLIAGLDLPDAGVIRLNGRLATGNGCFIQPHQRGLGFVFQEPALWPHMSVAQNIMFGIAGLKLRERRARLKRLLEATGLEGLGGRYPAQLSVGQARRVALARALAPMPRILLLDEPLTNVDAPTHEQLLALISAWRHETGATVVYVSHNRAEQERLCTQTLTLVQQRLALDQLPAPVDTRGG